MSERKVWSTEDIEFLRNNYKDLPIAQIAEKLGRKKITVAVKASKLGLKRVNYFWKDEHKQFVRENAMTMLAVDIAKHIGKKPADVILFFRRHKLQYKSMRKAYGALAPMPMPAPEPAPVAEPEVIPDEKQN